MIEGRGNGLYNDFGYFVWGFQNLGAADSRWLISSPLLAFMKNLFATLLGALKKKYIKEIQKLLSDWSAIYQQIGQIDLCCYTFALDFIPYAS